MKRLLTFGCSFTGYEFPTWAHLLGLSYEEFQNWGIMGSGNRSIVERLAEARAHNLIDSDTTIVVQWTTPYRNDFHKSNAQGLKWRTRGNLFNQPDLYDSSWVNNFYDETSYLMHTLNAIVLAQELLQNTGCNWYMTAIEDYDALIAQHPTLGNYNWKLYPERWLPNMSYGTNNWHTNVKELHPGIIDYLEWLQATPLPVSTEAIAWAADLQKLYKSAWDREDLLSKIRTHVKAPVWPHPLQGL